MQPIDLMKPTLAGMMYAYIVASPKKGWGNLVYNHLHNIKYFNLFNEEDNLPNIYNF
jgi:hypothetical protein